MTHGGTSECGTPWAVGRHRREGTEVCEVDRVALRAYQRNWAAARKARMVQAAAEATRRARGKAGARARFEAAVLVAHESGELVLG